MGICTCLALIHNALLVRHGGLAGGNSWHGLRLTRRHIGHVPSRCVGKQDFSIEDGSVHTCLGLPFHLLGAVFGRVKVS